MTSNNDMCFVEIIKRFDYIKCLVDLSSKLVKNPKSDRPGQVKSSGQSPSYTHKICIFLKFLKGVKRSEPCHKNNLNLL